MAFKRRYSAENFCNFCMSLVIKVRDEKSSELDLIVSVKTETPGIVGDAGEGKFSSDCCFA